MIIYSLRDADPLPLCAFLLTSLLLLFSCDGVPESMESDNPPCFNVELKLGDIPGTRATNVQLSDEGRVNRWSLCVYRVSDGLLAATGSSESGASIACTLPAGAYRAAAFVNPPHSGPGVFDPSSSLTGETPAAQAAYLSDNAAGALEMYGTEEFSLDTGPESIAIRASRLVSKVVLRKVTLRLSDSGLAASPFTLDAIYLDNVPSRTTWGADYDFDGLEVDRSRWYNAMGWHKEGSCQSPACPDAILGDRIGTIIAQGQTYQTEHVFYAVPNPTPASQDTRSATWAKRATRLVIEARIGSQTQYYVASLPQMRRNHSYVIEEAVITGLGAGDPELETPNSLELFFSVSDDGWEDGGTIIL